jgi:hypothetical protein
MLIAMREPHPVEYSPAEVFIAELKHWRDVRGLSQSALARLVSYDPSYEFCACSSTTRPLAAWAVFAVDDAASGQ